MQNSPVQKIKERLGIEEVVSSYIKLERSGANFKARCPFHNEKTPSFFVSPERDSYYCFGCGAKGDVFTFVSEFEGLDFKGTLRLLADKAGVPLESYKADNKSKDEKERLYEVMEAAARHFEANLKVKSDAVDYLKSRGVSDQSIAHWRIGFARDEWRDLYESLKSKGFSDKEIETAGLAKSVQKNGKQSIYDRFRGRIIFPINDTSGRVIAFSGRLFVENDKAAKYLNSPETPIFIKSKTLYGLDKAKISIRKNNFSILVEGQFDLVLSHQSGWHNTVATSGTALTESFTDQSSLSSMGLVRRISNNIVLAFDGDDAGVKAIERAGTMALSMGMDVKVAQLPDGKDPADVIVSSEGKEAWKDVVKNSKHVIEFLVGKIMSLSKDIRTKGKLIKEKILPMIAIAPSAIEQEFFIKRVADLSGISVAVLAEDLAKTETRGSIESQVFETKKHAEVLKRDYILRRLLGIVLWQQSLKEQKIDVAGLIKSIDDILQKSVEEILKESTETEELIFEAEALYGENEKIDIEIKELLANLEEESLKEDLAKKMLDLARAEENEDKNLIKEILEDCQIINNKIQEIKTGRLN